MKRYIFSVLLLSLMLLQNLYAQQDYLISGRVTDKTSGKPLIGANIFVEQTKLGTSTDIEGKFNFKLQPGSYIMSAGYIGYRVTKMRIIVTTQHINVDFELMPTVLKGQEVIVEAARAKERETPVVFTDIPRKEIRENYSVQDIPMLLSEIPGVYAYSDAGNGVGYTYLKVRGFDQKRVSVMINGIPLNDPEDHQVYWVNMPDFASSVHDIQIQRGVGSSLYGSSSFGGTVNVVTGELDTPHKFNIITGIGSYQTKKFSFNLNSGLINNNYAFSARFSKITSDGYRDNSAVDLWSYFISGVRYGLNSTIKFNAYGGQELTHAAWEASPQSELKKNHCHNPYTYPNSIDNFNQPHYELLHEWKISQSLTFSNTLFYVHGKGYYELFKSGRDLYEYGYDYFYLTDSTFVEETDIVRQKWVEKDQVGWITRVDREHDNGTFTFGAELYTFKSDHWGKVIWAAQLPPASEADHTYYRYTGKKNFGTIFLHELYRLTPELSVMGDFNLQLQKYKFEQQEEGNFFGANRNAYNVTYTFFSPRIGVNYNLSKEMNLFANVSIAHREPTDDDLFDVWEGPDDLGVAPLFKESDTVRTTTGEVDYIKWKDPFTKPEQLIDFELGFGYQSENLRLKMNAYWMDFQNEIVPFSEVNDDGVPIKGNADRTVHRGFEATLNVNIINGLSFSSSAAVSQNYFAKFYQYNALYDENGNITGTSTTDFKGNSIAGFPDLMANGKITYRNGSFFSYIHLQHIGKQYLDNTENDERSISAYTLLNLKLAYQLKNILGLKDLKLNFWMNNLLNKQYETAGYYDSWAGENFLWPGAERNFFVSLEFGL